MNRLKAEEGYSLAELVIAMAVTSMLFAAVWLVFDTSQKGYTRAAALEDAQAGARSGLDRMLSELRLAGGYWVGVIGGGNGITAAAETSITFVADVDADTVSAGVETTLKSDASADVTLDVSGVPTAFNTYTDTSLNDYAYVANGAAREVRQVSKVSGSTITLASALTSTYSKDSIVRSVETVTFGLDTKTNSITRKLGGGTAETLVDNVSALKLTYYDGSNPPVTTTDLSQIREIAITLTTKGSDGSLRTLTSRVRPRNLEFY